MRFRSAIVLVLLSTVVSCGGDGNGLGPEPGGDPYPLSSLDEPCDGSLTGRDLLGSVREEYTATLDYVEDRENTALTLRIRYEGGGILCHPATDGWPGPARAARVELEVRAEFITGDGLFGESFAASLSGAAGTGSSDLAAVLAPGQIRGTFDPEMPEHQNVTISFTAHLEGAQAAGAVFKGGRIPGRASEIIPVGYWTI